MSEEELLDSTTRETGANPPFMGAQARRSRPARASGAVLLEVVLALALFVGAATVIATGLNASVQSVFRLRLEAHAVNLAISVLSEIQMKARPAEPAGPEAFEEPFEMWTWQIEVTMPETVSMESDALQQVEVIIRHSEEPVVYRLTQWLPPGAAEGDASALGTPALF